MPFLSIAKDGLGAAKDGVAVLRDLVIAGLILMLIFRPGWVVGYVGGVLDAAEKGGFEGEAKFAGLTLKKKAQQARAEASNASNQSTAILKELADLGKLIKQLAGSDPRAAAQLNVLATKAGQIEKLLNDNVNNLKAATLAQDSIVEQSKDTTTGSSKGWGVIISADHELSPAQYEVESAGEKGFKGAQIYERDGWYRTVLRFDSKEEALNSLPDLQSKIRKGVYLVNLSSWCSGQTLKDRIISCESGTGG